MATKDTPEKAIRYARYIVQDIEMYNKKKVEESLAGDNFFEKLASLFSEGKEEYNAQVPPELQERGFFEQALVDVILYRKKNMELLIWD
ncbi:MAG: hypothetical protein AAGJ35_10510 [Myxococcota bacterium]